VIERELCFTDEDMTLFAAGSGDTSPLHTDPVFGRCSAYGSCIVYGGLLSLGLLGTLPPEVLAQIRSVRSSFPGPVLPGATSVVRAVPHPSHAGRWEVKVLGRGKVLARVIADTHQAGPTAAATLARAAALDPADPRPDGPLDVGDSIDEPYEPGPELAALARRFGAESLHPALLDGIGWASYLVGMGMPGYQGLCAAVDVTLAAESVPTAERGTQGRLLVRDHDERTQRRVVEGVLSSGSGAPRTIAQIESFPVAVRPPPDATALGLAASSAQRPGSVVVVGGSRGLGAALSLALLARGYVVHVVYAISAQAAAGLAALAGPSADRLFLHRIDVRDPRALAALVETLRSDGTPLEGLMLNAATPALAMGLTAESGTELADYVADALRLAAVPLGSLLPLLAADGGWIVFTSSAAVANPARELPQLTAAKAALEGLARWVASVAPRARTVVIRPPAQGDRTNGVASAEETAVWVLDRLGRNDLPPGFHVLEGEATETAAP
jgi:NAD(P)-dependent dehydrogenase (short-subunit alcohol dehydrogenase family)/acyl dehydratase